MSRGDFLPETLWDIQAIELARTHGLDPDAARNYVILERLQGGDVRPLYDWLLLGHPLSRNVLMAILCMLMRGDPKCDFDPAKFPDPNIAELFPDKLVVVREGRGAPKDMDGAVLKALAGRHASALMDTGKYGKVAVHETHEYFANEGASLGDSTIGAAMKLYRRARKKRQGK